MPSRLELELTSKNQAGDWTWRKAGAKEPKGVVAGSLLYEGAKVGDIVKAEVTFEIDGIFVESVYAPQESKDAKRGMIIEISPQRSTKQLSSVEYAKSNKSKSRGKPSQRGQSDSSEGDRSQHAGSKRDRPQRPRAAQGTGVQPESPSNDQRRPDRVGDRARKDSPDAKDSRLGMRRDDRRRPDNKRPYDSVNSTSKPPTLQRYAKITPGTKHRDELLQSLPTEHLSIAEQLVAGGLPAVRTAIAAQNQEMAKQGKAPMPSDPILNIAEEILPVVERATWLDRADAVLAVSDNVGLRDLKTVVSFGERVAKSEEFLEILNRLKVLLDTRTKTLEKEWVKSIEDALEENKSIKAVRLASRSPDIGSQLPAELLQRLTDAANITMTPSSAPEHWAAMLSALETSPIRRLVTPTGLPENPTPELTALAQQLSGRIPNLATLLGIKMPPPPRPRRKIADEDTAPSETVQDTAPSETVQDTAPSETVQDTAPSETVQDTAPSETGEA